MALSAPSRRTAQLLLLLAVPVSGFHPMSSLPAIRAVHSRLPSLPHAAPSAPCSRSTTSRARHVRPLALRATANGGGGDEHAARDGGGEVAERPVVEYVGGDASPVVRGSEQDEEVGGAPVMEKGAFIRGYNAAEAVDRALKSAVEFLPALVVGAGALLLLISASGEVEQVGTVVAVAVPLALLAAYLRTKKGLGQQTSPPPRTSSQALGGTSALSESIFQTSSQGVAGECPACGAPVRAKQTGGGRCMACGEVVAVALGGRIVAAPDPEA